MSLQQVAPTVKTVNPMQAQEVITPSAQLLYECGFDAYCSGIAIDEMPSNVHMLRGYYGAMNAEAGATMPADVLDRMGW